MTTDRQMAMMYADQVEVIVKVINPELGVGFGHDSTAIRAIGFGSGDQF
jgi:hypothetical protein